VKPWNEKGDAGSRPGGRTWTVDTSWQGQDTAWLFQVSLGLACSSALNTALPLMQVLGGLGTGPAALAFPALSRTDRRMDGGTWVPHSDATVDAWSGTVPRGKRPGSSLAAGAEFSEGWAHHEGAGKAQPSSAGTSGILLLPTLSPFRPSPCCF